MPRKVTAYACQFKCGERVNTKKGAIALHENICFSNPARRACKTCNSWVNDGDGLFCWDEHPIDNDYATFNCPYWNEKNKGVLG